MNASKPLCNDSQLLDLIADRLAGENLESMLLHIEHCECCRERMEELSAESHHWQKAVAALSGFRESEQHYRGSSPINPHQPDRPTSGPSLALASNMSNPELLARQLLSAPSHPEMLGRLGRYEVERLIGSGGMGVVFKAFDTELNRPVAIKVLAPHLASSGSARQRFAREARAAAAVVNEHVVPIHNVETDGETSFLVMKYIDGESLQARLDRYGPLDVEVILRIGMQVAAGLAAAHQQGLVHRDIKPANILLEQGLERALITDFGLARAVDDASLTHTGFHAGTPQYMSPEQVAGHAVDFRSDLFSLGSVMYAMCTGRPPFRAENSFGVLKRIAEDEPRAISEINPRIPLWLDCVIKQLLAKSPEFRLSSAADVSQLLAQCLNHSQNPASSSLPSVIETWLKPRPSPSGNDNTPLESGWQRLMLASSAVGLVVICLAALFMTLYQPDVPVTVNGSQARQAANEPPALNANAKANDSNARQQPEQAFDPELEWDAAVRAVQSTENALNKLEQKLSQEEIP